MRRSLVLGALLVLGLSIPATSASAEIYWRDVERSAAVEPGRIDVFHGAGSYTYVTGLRNWHHWGARRTWARGRIWANNCQPSCANGDYRPHRGKVKLSRIHRCGNRRFYGRVVFVFTRTNRYRDRRISVGCDGYERW